MPEIIIVEDENTILMALNMQLKSIGTLQAYRNAREAKSRIKKSLTNSQIDLAIIDLQHPRGGTVDPDAGFAVIAELERNTPSTPIIILSIRNDHEAWEKASNYKSVRYFFTKPWDAIFLRKAARKCLAGKANGLVLVGTIEGVDAHEAK